MAAYDHIVAASNDDFASRVTMFVMEACIDVANEPDTAADHAVRIGFAYRMFRGDVNTKILAMGVIASNATIQATISANPGNFGSDVPDGDLQYATNGLITHFARAYAAA